MNCEARGASNSGYLGLPLCSASIARLAILRYPPGVAAIAPVEPGAS